MTVKTKKNTGNIEPEVAGSGKPEIRARRFDVDYSKTELDKHWALGDPFLTHWLNAYTMTIPGGEAMIVKTVEEHMDKIEDRRLKKEAQGLIGQELSHSQGHLKFIDLLHRQGYSTRFFEVITNFLSYKIMEPTSTPVQRLAFITGVERINELFAEVTLASGVLRKVPAPAGILYEWHLAEEIEHKSVVFDLYHHVYGSRFWLRYGMFMSLVVNLAYLGIACSSFLWQDGKLFSPKTWRSAWRYFFKEERFLPRMIRGCRELLRKGFHPSHTDNRELAEHVLSRRVITAS